MVFLYGTLLLAGRRSGYVVMLLVGSFAAAMPVIHMRGVHYGEIASAGWLVFLYPPLARATSRYVILASLGEVLLVLWLSVKGRGRKTLARAGHRGPA